MRPLPPFRRWLFEPTLRGLVSGPEQVTVLRGPRQVGKTTLQGQIIHYLLNEKGVDPKRIFRVQFDEIPSLKGLDDPILGLCRWFENKILRISFNKTAGKGEPAFVFFDEAQNLADWAPQVKALVDHHAVRVLLAGSSAIRIERGRDSLAGRVSTLELGTLLLREIAELRGFGTIPPALPFNGLGDLKEKDFWRELANHGLDYRVIRDKAFTAFSERGGYPMAQAEVGLGWEDVSKRLNETIIRRVIQHDLRLGERGRWRDENLLEEVFRLSCRYAGQAPSKAI